MRYPNMYKKPIVSIVRMMPSLEGVDYLKAKEELLSFASLATSRHSLHMSDFRVGEHERFFIEEFKDPGIFTERERRFLYEFLRFVTGGMLIQGFDFGISSDDPIDEALKKYLAFIEDFAENLEGNDDPYELPTFTPSKPNQGETAGTKKRFLLFGRRSGQKNS